MTRGSIRPPDPLLDPALVHVPEWTRYLDVDADLVIEVETGTGERATGRLTGHGDRLRLELDHPELLTGTTDRSAIAALGAQLARAHLRAEFHGPRGRIAFVDPAQKSRVAAVLTGSPHIGIDRAGWALAARAVSPTTLAAVAGSVAALLATAAIIRRFRS